MRCSLEGGSGELKYERARFQISWLSDPLLHRPLVRRDLEKQTRIKKWVAQKKNMPQCLAVHGGLVVIFWGGCGGWG